MILHLYAGAALWPIFTIFGVLGHTADVITHVQCWGRVNSNEFNSRVNSFTVSYEFELTHLRDGEL